MPPKRASTGAPIACPIVNTQMQTCYRHADRHAGVICQRCDRPICPDCMQQASVGFHCPECTKSGAQKIVRPAQLLRPLVTQILVGINLFIFAVGIGAGLQTRDRVIYEGGLVGLGLQPASPRSSSAWPPASGTASSPAASSTPT